MILTTVFASAGALFGGFTGGKLGAFNGTSLKTGFIFAAAIGSVGAGIGYAADHVFGNFDEEPLKVITVEQQQSISKCTSNTPEGMDAIVTLDDQGNVNCLYAPK